MKQIGAFFSGFVYAINLIVRKKLFAAFIPAILLSCLFYFLFSGGQLVSKGISFMEDWWLIGWLIASFKSLFGFLYFFLFEFFILVLLSPINSYFAEKVREDITKEKLGFSMGVFLRSLRRMIGIFFLAFFMQIILSIFLWLFSFMLGEKFHEIASILNISFFIGFSFFDFGLELNEINTKDSWKFAKQNWVACLLIGLVFTAGVYYPQKHELIIGYALGIAFLPHLLTIVAGKVYFQGIKKGVDKI